MFSPELIKILNLVAPWPPKAIDTQKALPDPLRRDLSDNEYADWFLDAKITRGVTNSAHYMNDFVLFRLAYKWPKGATNWVIDEDDIVQSDFSLTQIEEGDLTSMAREGLTDGYVPAEWYAKVAAILYIHANKGMPEALFNFLQERLFLPPTKWPDSKKGSGRKKTDGMDRDRIIRNLVEGLLLRNSNQPQALGNARATAAAALGRKGTSITDDGVRKVCARSIRTSREKRLWALILDLDNKWFSLDGKI